MWALCGSAGITTSGRPAVRLCIHSIWSAYVFGVADSTVVGWFRMMGGPGTKAAMAVDLVVLVVAFEPDHLGIAFTSQDVGGDAVEEPAAM